MTRALSGEDVARQVAEQFPRSVVAAGSSELVVDGRFWPAVAAYLKSTPGLAFDYLAWVTAVDYPDYFEVVYQLVSLPQNHSLVVKVRLTDRANPAIASVAGLWRGADLQEREIYDLMGIRFEGHPNLERIVLWEGFAGYPLRKEFP
jgi:NADH-quinone oxidoreductase subunit C